MKVLIVDDGHYIVEYLKHLLDWGKFGVEQVETTTNPIEAKRLLQESPADILITDIRMPEVSGIDLLEHVVLLKLDTKVILLSGYSEFEYAQQAIRLGVFDYLLKPVDKDDMEKAMRKVTQAIKASRPEPVGMPKSIDGFGQLLSAVSVLGASGQESAGHGLPAGREPVRFFQLPLEEMLNEETRLGDREGELKLYEWQEDLRLHSRQKEPKQRNGQEKLSARGRLAGFYLFLWETPSLVAGVASESSWEQLKDAAPSIVLSEPFQLEAESAVREAFYRFFYQEEVGAGDMDAMQDKGEFSSLESREWECARHKIQKRYPRLTNRKQKIMYLVEAARCLYLTGDNVLADEVQEWLFKRMGQPDDVYDLMISALSRLGREAELSNADIVNTIQTYIAGHLEEALSLEDLGKVVHLHPVYLSKFYKQQTGENLSAYILLKRMERAARLLIESNLHVMDISRMVGYRKPQYFIKLFKEQYGVTPQQYRKKQIKFVES